MSGEIKKIFSAINEEQADLNYDKIRTHNNRAFPASAIIDWKMDLGFIEKKFRLETFEKNLMFLEEYIKLCIENDAKPFAVNFPFAPIMNKNCGQNMLANFRVITKQFEKIYDFKFIDLFDLPLDYTCFYNSTHLNLKGSYLASSVLSYRLYEENILPIENFCKMDNNFFDNLALIIPKNNFDKFVEKIRNYL